jgi:hypothetical protein
MQLRDSPMFQRDVALPSSESKNEINKKAEEVGNFSTKNMARGSCKTALKTVLLTVSDIRILAVTNYFSMLWNNLKTAELGQNQF